MPKLPKTWRSLGYKRHLVSTVSDGGVVLVITKHWRQTKRRWEYEATELWLVEQHLKWAADDRRNARQKR